MRRSVFVAIVFALCCFTGCDREPDFGLLAVSVMLALVGCALAVVGTPIAMLFAGGCLAFASTFEIAGLNGGFTEPRPVPAPPSHVAPAPKKATPEHVAEAPARLEEHEGPRTPPPVPRPWFTSWKVVTHDHDGADYLGGPVELGRTRTPLHALGDSLTPR